METFWLVILIIVWSVLGGAMTREMSDIIKWNTSGFEYLNPCWIYKHYQVNWLGCILLFLWYSLLCPLGLIIYWFYKLCTIGRK